MAPAVSGFDPDTPDEGFDGASPDVWVDPFDDAGDAWEDPLDDPALDTPAARADWAYGRAVDPATPGAVLRTVLADVLAWDVDALLAEAAVLGGAEDGPPPRTADRPDVVVLRQVLRHPNRPDDLPTVLLEAWLEDPAARSPWPLLVGLADDGTVDEDLLVTALSEATDACRRTDPPPWALLLLAVAAARADTTAAHDLLAMVPLPLDDPARLWPDVEPHAAGLPGGTRQRARAGAELLGWDGRRHPGLPAAVAEALHADDRARRGASFADRIEVCAHGPVVVTPTAVTLPTTARGAKPYVARIVGSHPVFRLKRDWPDRDDGAGGTAWSWQGAQVLEARDLGCETCRADLDRGKRYFVTTGTEVATVRLRLVQQVLDALDAG